MSLVWGIRFAFLLAFVAVVAIAFMYRADAKEAEGERDLLKRDLAAERAANIELSTTIDKLTAWRAREDRLLGELRAATDEIHKAARASNDAVAEMRQTNAAVAEFLSLPIPDDLNRLLNNPGAPIRP